MPFSRCHLEEVQTFASEGLPTKSLPRACRGNLCTSSAGRGPSLYRARGVCQKLNPLDLQFWQRQVMPPGGSWNRRHGAQACSEAGVHLSLPFGHCALDALALRCLRLISATSPHRGKGKLFSAGPSQPRSRRAFVRFSESELTNTRVVMYFCASATLKMYFCAVAPLLYPAYTPDLSATEFEHRLLHRSLHGGSIAEMDRVCFIVPDVCAWNQFSVRRAEHGLANG